MDGKNKKPRTRNILIRNISDIFMPIALIFGLYVILHGTISPGGGFQGGVIVASAALLMYLGYGYETASRVFNMSLFKKGEAVAAIVYVLLAFCGILFGASFCSNIFFNETAVGSIFSSGTISYMNYTVGFKVLTGISFLLLLLLGMLAPGDEEPEEMIDELPVEDVLDAISVITSEEEEE